MKVTVEPREPGGVLTREELIQYLDADIAKNERHWGVDYIYTKWAREAKEKKLADFDAGVPVLYCKEPYHENGMDFETEYYTDGSIRTACYGWSD